MTPFHRQLPPSRRLAVGTLLVVGSVVLSSDLAGSVLEPARALEGLESLWSSLPVGPGLAPAAAPAESVPLAAAAPPTPVAPTAAPEPAAYLTALPFGAEIARAAERHGVDALLVAAIIEAESNFRPDAVSEKGALGLMQVMPFHLESPERPLAPAENLEIGTGYLATLLERFDGDLALALAAYHAGPGAVERFGGFPPYASTRRYVARVLTCYEAHLAELTIVREAEI
jgi:soluble lytic murein transglycosylase-like protein